MPVAIESPPDPALIARAAVYLDQILSGPFEHPPSEPVLVVYDRDSELAEVLREGYRQARPQATLVEFDREHPERVLTLFEGLDPTTLVVLVQSTSFRLAKFRIRIELFRRGFKVIEHPHLGRMPGGQVPIYVDSLEYDAGYYRGVGQALRERIDRASRGELSSGSGELLTYPAGFEPAKLNVGDYSELTNVGGQFPIGEVFTESLELEAVNGRVRIGCFGDTSFQVNHPPAPITLVVEAGRIADVLDSTPEFDRVLSEIRAVEEVVWLRELGLGLNRAFSFDRVVTDIGTFERMCGVHLSLGAKHTTYNKPSIKKRAARFHVDVFALADAVRLDDEVVFEGGAWTVAGD